MVIAVAQANASPPWAGEVVASLGALIRPSRFLITPWLDVTRSVSQNGTFWDRRSSPKRGVTEGRSVPRIRAERLKGVSP